MSRGYDWLPKGHEMTFKRKMRITGYTLGSLLGRSPFGTVPGTVLKMLGLVKSKKNPAMMNGIKKEPMVRKMYASQTKDSVTEAPMAFSRKHPYLGVAVDGLVGTNGILEIKCPVKMYPPLLEDPEERPGETMYERVHYDIYESHYLQMQLGLYVLDREWCDYVVYTPDKMIIERIEYDSIYFDQVLTELEENFIPKYQQLLDQLGIKLVSLEKGIRKGEIKNKAKAIELVHEQFQDHCTCDDSNNLLECCLRTVS